MTVTLLIPGDRHGHSLSKWMAVVLRRPERVSCVKCGANHPAIYAGQRCLLCGWTIDIGNGQGTRARTMNLRKQGARKARARLEAQIAALQVEREELWAALRAARNRERVGSASDYELHVELAAKGLAQRDKYPMPPSVTTPEGFYEVMAGAALEATGFLGLLERVALAERNLEVIQDALREADVKAENARHRTMSEEIQQYDKN